MTNATEATTIRELTADEIAAVVGGTSHPVPDPPADPDPKPDPFDLIINFPHFPKPTGVIGLFAGR
jgi:hypothetical protein